MIFSKKTIQTMVYKVASLIDRKDREEISMPFFSRETSPLESGISETIFKEKMVLENWDGKNKSRNRNI